MRHTITKSEMLAIKIGHVMASTSEGAGKRIMFTYDVGRKRLEYVVFKGHGADPGYAFDALEEAIEAYNEI